MSNKRIGIILDVDAEVSKAKGNIGSLSKVFEGIGGKQGNQLRDILADINTEYSKLADESGKTMSKIGDFSKAEKSLQKLDQLFGKLEKELGSIDKMSDSDLNKLFPPEVADRIKKASDAIKTYNTYVEESSKTKGAIGQATKQYEDQEKAVRKAAQALKELEDIQKGASKKQVVSADTKVFKANEVKAAVAELNQYEKELVEAQSKMEEFKNRKADLFTRGTQNKSSEFRQLNQDLEAAEKNFNDATTKATELKRELKNMVVQGDLDNEIKDAEKALEDAQIEAKELKKNLEDIRTEEMTKAFDQAKDKLKELANIDLDNLVQIDDIIDLFKRFQQDGIEGVTEGIEQLKSGSKDLGNVTKDMGSKISEATDKVEEQNKAMGEIQGIKNRVLEFFSLNNAMQLAQRAMQQTFQTIKELDKAMTETAVVTDFSVGDMWDALPRYTKAANELGTTTLGAYETMTLFYQQGLDTNEAFAIGTETMKMARIAGLEYAEATDLMTAALRGFNMELNETSAQRINDVYSELAAITAADTEEIATAMTKTASIAKSANMEFETTAAFLSQIIETTREPAETAGTAMKTIIARFTEMKKASSDVINFEGEEINVNKVEEALKSAGVALRDVNGEFRDTDDVFLELASKWDNLDIMTQRYIATMAAGSRQQSRFLAMMQDYDRTVELIDAAYNSSGASQAQFLKTQDSLESKLNKLKNAWNEFLMGITNSKAIKVGVDLLTGLLNIINKLTGNSGLGKLTVALGAIFGGKMISNKIFGNIGSSIATSFLKPLADAGVLADNVTSKIKGLGNGSLWQQVKNGVGAFVKGLTTAGSVAGALLPVLLAVAAVLAVIGAAWYFSDEQVETRKLKEAQELAEGLAKGLEDAREAVTTIADDKSGLETLKNELKELVVGTEEWRLKLLEVQAEESKLIGKYNLGNVEGAIQVDQYGNQTITKSGWDYVEKKQSDAVSRQLTASQIANAAVNRQQFELEKVQKIEAAEDESAGKADEWIGGTIGAAAGTALGAAGGLAGLGLGLGMAIKGALAGAAYGTIATPIVGTIVGALGGAITGAAIGFGANELIEEFGHDEEYQKTVDQTKKEERIANQQQTLAYKNAFKSSMSNNDDFSLYSAEELDAVATLSAANIDKYIEEEEKAMGIGDNNPFTLNGANKDEIKDWAENYKGYTYKDDKVYDAQGKEVDISDNEAIAKELATFKAMEKTEEVAKTAAAHLKTGGEAVKELGKDITGSDFAKIMSGDSTANYDLVDKMQEEGTADDIASKILEGNEGREAELIASLTGYTEEEVAKGLKKNDNDYTKYLSSILQDKAKETDQNQQYMKEDFYEEIAKSGVIIDSATVEIDSSSTPLPEGVNAAALQFSDGFNAQNGLSIFEQLDAASVKSVTNISQSLRESFGKAGIGGQKFIEGLSGMNLDQVKATISYLDGVDFSNPIQGAAAFRKALEMEGENSEVGKLVTELQGISDNEYDLGSQFDFLYSSGVFENLSEPMAELIEENGKLTADNVLELADASEELALFLENDKISADGLATALTMVATRGPDAMQGITSATLAAVSSTETLSTAFENMVASIEGFEPAVDTMSGIDFTNQSLEKMKEMIDSGEYGNTQLQSYLKYFYGDNAGKSQGDIDKQYKQLTEWSKNEGRNFWTEAQAKGVLGTGDSFSTTFKTGNLGTMDIAEGLTTKQALENIQTKMGLTEEAATNYLAVLTSHSVELSEKLQANDAAAAAKTLYNERLAELTEAKADTSVVAFGDAELQLLAEKYGRTVDQIKEEIAAAAGTETKVVFAPSFVDTEGRPLTGEALIEKLNGETQNGNIALEDLIVKVDVDGEETIDYLETKELMLDVGLNEEQANEAINQFLKNTQNEKGENTFEFSAEGKIIPKAVTAEEANEWASSAVNQVEESTVQVFADTLANLSYAATGKKLAKDVKTEIEKSTFNVSLQPKIKEFKSKISAAISNGSNTTSGNWYVNFYKDGSDGIPKDQVGMTGEEGTELIQSKDGTARLVGTNGPELTSLKKGDVIYTAEETKKILKGKSPSKPFPAYAKGTGSKTKVNNLTGKLDNGMGKPTKIELVVNIDAQLEALDRQRENGKIDAGTYQDNKEKLLTQKWYALQKDFNKELSNSPQKKHIYYDAKDDQVKLKDSYNSLSEKAKEEVMKEYNKIKDINDQLNDIEDELGDISVGKVAQGGKSGKSDNNKTNNDARMEALERQRENGEISALDYQNKKKGLLEDKQSILQSELDHELSSNTEKDFFKYDASLDTILLNTEKFNKLTKERQEEVLKEYEKVKGINDELNSVEDELAKIPGTLNNTTNENAKLQNADRQRELGNLNAMDYDKAKAKELKSKQTKLTNQLNSDLKKDPDKDYFNYDAKQGLLTLNETEFNKLSKEEQDKIQSKYNDYKKQVDDINAVKDERAELKKKNKNDVTNQNAELEELQRQYENGEIGADTYNANRKKVLKTKKNKMKNQLKDSLANDADAAYFNYDEEKGTLKLDQKKFNKLSKESQDKILEKYNKYKEYSDGINDITDELKGRKKNKSYDTTNEEAKLEDLERKLRNGDISAEDYQSQKKTALQSKKEKLESQISDELAADADKKFFNYNSDTGEFLLNETEFNKLSEEQQQDILQKYDNYKGKVDQVNEIRDEQKLMAEQGGNDTTNEDAKLESLDRKLANGKISASEYAEQKRTTLQNKETKLRNEFNEQLGQSANKEFFEYDEATGEFLLNQEKLNGLSEELQAQVKQEYETLKGINDEANGIKDALEDVNNNRYDTTNENTTTQFLEHQLEQGNIDVGTFNEQMDAAEDTIISQYQKKEAEVYTQDEDIASGLLVQGADGKFTIDKEKYKKLTKAQKKALKAKQESYNNGGYRVDADVQDGLIYTDPKTGMFMIDQTKAAGLSEEEYNKLVSKVDGMNAEKLQNMKLQESNADRSVANKNDTTQEDIDLAELERQLQNGEIDAVEYKKKRDEINKTKRDKALAEAQRLMAEDPNYGKYYTYDEETQTLSMTEDYYNLPAEMQEKLKPIFDAIEAQLGIVQDIDDTIKDPEFGKEGTRGEYERGNARVANTDSMLNSLDRRGKELDGYNSLISKLPSEMQGPLNLVTGAVGMAHQVEENQILRAQQDGYESIYNARLANAKYQDYYYWDYLTKSWHLDDEKIQTDLDNGTLDSSAVDAIVNEQGTLNDDLSKIYDIDDMLNGGIFQKPFYLARDAAAEMQKAFQEAADVNGDNIIDSTDKVTSAFAALEKKLGLTTGSLDKFKEKVLSWMKDDKGNDKTFKSSGILNKEAMEKLKKSSIGTLLNDDTYNLLEALYGTEYQKDENGDFVKDAAGNFIEIAKETPYADIFDSLLGTISGGFGMLGDSINFETIGMGMDMANTMKGIADQIKAKIEEIIGYITQTTQVLVDAWTNREDYLYNYLKLIEKHLAEYEKLQRYSTQIQKGRIATADDIAKNWEDQWASLQKQLEEQTERLETRQQELDRSRWNPFMLISGWDPLSDTLYENRDVKMLWDIIIGLGEAFAPLGTGTFFSQLNQLYEDYDKRVQQSYEDRFAAEQALLDIEDERLDLVKVGADEATQFEDKVLQAFIQKEQQVIDELSRLNDAVTTANQKLMSTLQDNLSKIRQDRENEKKEEELGEKERKLAYLRQDTSGANTMEIKRLEKELDEQHEDYTDTLIDQKISELEKQNELAAEQRQQQIDLLQGQLDYAEKYGLYWETIYDMLYSIDENGKVVINADNFDVDGNIRENSQLAQLLGTHSDRMGMSTWQSVLDNEETKLLGLYYKAFMTRNGADGNWADYWALLDPGANDPDYTRQMAEIPGGLRGVLSRLEIGIREYFGTSNPGLVNMGRSAEQGLKNFFGKLFNYEPWETFKAEEFNKAYVEADTMNAIHRAEVGIVNSVKDGFNNFFGLNQKAAQTGRQTTEKAKSNNNNYGTQNYGAVTENYNFNIGTVGESISLDDMIDKVTSAIKGLFTPDGVTYAKKGH